VGDNQLEDIDVKGGTLGLIHIVLGKIEVKLDNVSEKIKDIETLIRDHETRLRNLEKSNYIYYGGFLVINVIVQLVLRKVL